MISWINQVRAIFALMVVFVHVLPVFSEKSDALWRVKLYDIFLHGSTCFMFLSGFLIGYKKSKNPVYKFLVMRFKRVFVPYICVSSPALVFFTFFEQKSNHEWLYLKSNLFIVWYFIASGSHMAHLWFVPVYIISVAVVKLADQLGCLVGNLSAFILTILLLKTAKGDNLVSCVHLSAVGALGVLFGRRFVSISNYFSPNKGWVMAVAIFSLVASGFSFFDFINTATAFKILFASCCLVWFHKTNPPRLGVYLNILGSMSFSVYLIHPYFVWLSRYYGKLNRSSEVFSGIFLALIASVLIVFLTVLTIKAASRLVPHRSKLLIGY